MLYWCLCIAPFTSVSPYVYLAFLLPPCASHAIHLCLTSMPDPPSTPFPYHMSVAHLLSSMHVLSRCHPLVSVLSCIIMWPSTPKPTISQPKIFLVRVWFGIYSISSTCVVLVILEPIALTMLEIRLGERAPVSGSRSSRTQCLAPPNFPYTLSPARSKRRRFVGWDGLPAERMIYRGL